MAWDFETSLGGPHRAYSRLKYKLFQRWKIHPSRIQKAPSSWGSMFSGSVLWPSCAACGIYLGHYKRSLQAWQFEYKVYLLDYGYWPESCKSIPYIMGDVFVVLINMY